VKSSSDGQSSGTPLLQHTCTLPSYSPHQLLGALARLGVPGEAPTQAEAHRGDHQDTEVGGHQPDGIGDVLQVQPVKGKESPLVVWGGQAPGREGRGWRDPRGGRERAYLVIPTCRERISQGLPAERGAGDGVRQRAPSTPTPCRQEARGSPVVAERGWCQGCSQKAAFTRRETKAQPGRAKWIEGPYVLSGTTGTPGPDPWGPERGGPCQRHRGQGTTRRLASPRGSVSKLQDGQHQHGTEAGARAGRGSDARQDLGCVGAGRPGRPHLDLAGRCRSCPELGGWVPAADSVHRMKGTGR